MTFNPIMLAAALAAGSLPLFAGPAAADPVRVGYADLDLATSAGAAAMDARLRQASQRACSSVDGRLLAERMACIDDAYRSGREQMRRRIAQADTRAGTVIAAR